MFSATFSNILEDNCITTFKYPIYRPVSTTNSSCLLSHYNAQVFEDKVDMFILRDKSILLVLDCV